jgi:hypothetical protein
MDPQDILDILADLNPEAILWDGFEGAVIGFGERCGLGPVAVYSWDRMVQILSDEMDEEEAAEYINYNILGAYVGEYTPIIMTLEVAV